MKFIILCPFGAQTGGPEACYQLSDMLLRQGFEAEMWLLTDEDLVALREMVRQGTILADLSMQVPRRSNPVAEYSRYQSRAFTSYSPGDEVTFILPEIYAWMVPLLLGQRVLVWWLSVDGAFPALGGINLDYLRMRHVRHAVQSEYAHRFVRALGLAPSRLSDYTIIPDDRPLAPPEQRPMRVALNANHKVIANLDLLTKSIEQFCPGAEVLRVAKMTRAQVSEIFASARLFIDLGKMPGKDRMPREALLMGANIIVSRSGSGAFVDDFSIPEAYRTDPFDMNYIARLAAHMLLNPEVHVQQFAGFRSAIALEKQTFAKEVLDVFSVFHHG